MSLLMHSNASLLKRHVVACENTQKPWLREKCDLNTTEPSSRHELCCRLHCDCGDRVPRGRDGSLCANPSRRKNTRTNALCQGATSKHMPVAQRRSQALCWNLNPAGCAAAPNKKRACLNARTAAMNCVAFWCQLSNENIVTEC